MHGQDAQDLSNFKQPIVSAFCWLSFIVQNFILKKYKMSVSRGIALESNFLCEAENNLSKHVKNHQLDLIRTIKKLKSYSIFKYETNYSEFINHIRNPEHGRVASKFRIGNHNIKIETGRFTIPKTWA